MVTVQAYEMAIRAVKKHKRVDISYPRAVMAVFDLIYPDEINSFLYSRSMHLQSMHWEK